MQIFQMLRILTDLEVEQLERSFNNSGQNNELKNLMAFTDNFQNLFIVGNSRGTLLEYAIKNGYINIVQFLIEHHWDINDYRHKEIPNEFRNTIKRMAVINSFFSLFLLTLFYASGAFKYFPNEPFYKKLLKLPTLPWVDLETKSNSATEQWSLSLYIILAHPLTPFLLTALLTLFISNHYLIQKLVSPHAQDESSTHSPLVLAAANQQASIVGYLLDKGAHPYATNKKGYTGLHLAVLNNDIATLHFFHQKKVNINYKSVRSQGKFIKYSAIPSPLELAIQKNSLDAIIYFATHSDISQKFGFSQDVKSYPHFLWLLLSEVDSKKLPIKMILFTLFKLSAVVSRATPIIDAKQSLPPARRAPLEIWTKIAHFYFLDTCSSQVQTLKNLISHVNASKTEAILNEPQHDYLSTIIENSMASIANHHHTYLQNTVSSKTNHFNRS